MQIVGLLLYLVIGLVQLAAIQAGLSEWMGLHWIFAIPLSLFLAYLPLIGAILGFVGATSVWQWAWWQAGLLFFGGLAFVAVLGGLNALVEHFDRSRRA